MSKQKTRATALDYEAMERGGDFFLAAAELQVIGHLARALGQLNTARLCKGMADDLSAAGVKELRRTKGKKR